MKKIMQWGLVVVLLGLLSTTENFAGACHSRRVDVEEVSPFVDEALAVNPVMFFPYGFSQTLGHLPSYSVACAQPDAVPLEFCPPPSYNVVREETAVEVYRETLGVLSQSEEILGAASDSGPNADYDDFILHRKPLAAMEYFLIVIKHALIVSGMNQCTPIGNSSFKISVDTENLIKQGRAFPALGRQIGHVVAYSGRLMRQA